MDLLSLLKQLNRIEPDRNYTAWSRATILSAPPAPTRPLIVIWRSFARSLEFGSAIALVSVFLIVLGGLSSSDPLAPLKLESLDPASLRAEAEAIDIQIQLTNIGYAEPVVTTTAQLAPTGPATTIQTLPPPTPSASPLVKQKAEEEAQNLGIAPHPTSSLESGDVSIDEALEELSK